MVAIGQLDRCVIPVPLTRGHVMPSYVRLGTRLLRGSVKVVAAAAAAAKTGWRTHATLALPTGARPRTSRVSLETAGETRLSKLGPEPKTLHEFIGREKFTRLD